MSSRPSKKHSRKSGDSSAKLARLSEPLQECFAILKFFQSRPDADAFTEPVDWEAFGLMDYPEIITHPMDLGTIQTKLEDGKYASPADFSKDMRLVWKNAMTYNRPDSDIFETAEKLAKLFEKKISKIKSNKKARTEGGAGGADETQSNREVTRADRVKFAAMVSGLSSEQLGSLVQMIQKECPEAINDDDEEELEIEINNLDHGTLQQLNAFCQKCVDEKAGAAAGGEVKKENGGAAAAGGEKKKK